VSGTRVTPAAGGSQRDTAGSANPAPSRRWSDPVTLAIAGFTLLGLALRLFLLSRPGYLLGVTQYDDGPYFGSALRLVHGALPYRDFIIVQPPGITLLMTPAALLAQVTGTAWGMAVGRILTVLASSAGILIVGLLVRHRGLIPVSLACGILAIFPGSLVAAHTVLLEPWLTLFCLIGALVLLDRDRFAASGRRLVWAGVAFGFAGAVEVWAILPVLVVAVLLLRQAVPRAARFVAGVAIGFLVPVVPFALAAPRRFYNSFFAAQLFRVVPSRTPVEKRLRLMTGIGQVLHLGSTGVLILSLAIVALIVAALPVAWLITRRPLTDLDWFAVGSCTLIVAGFLWYAQFFLHFPAFLAPFLGLSIGLAAARLTRPSRAQPADTGRGWIEWTVAGLITLGVLALAIPQANQERSVTPRVSAAALAAVRRIVPPGACVLTDQVSYTIAADRFYSTAPGCSLLVDSIGTDYALGHGRDASSGAARYPAVDAVWRDAFHHAQYVWLSVKYNPRRIAWTPALRSYFRSHFHPVLHDGTSDVLYARTR
jgi:alpha-1,2-mannosyltransferase